MESGTRRLVADVSSAGFGHEAHPALPQRHYRLRSAPVHRGRRELALVAGGGPTAWPAQRAAIRSPTPAGMASHDASRYPKCPRSARGSTGRGSGPAAGAADPAVRVQSGSSAASSLPRPPMIRPDVTGCSPRRPRLAPGLPPVSEAPPTVRQSRQGHPPGLAYSSGRRQKSLCMTQSQAAC